jgi:hypothetical protein
MASPWENSMRFELPGADLKVQQYKEKFDKKSTPYVLPQVNYVGSFESENLNFYVAQTYVAVPIKNQEAQIFPVLESLCVSMKENFILGVLLDNCTDARC